MKKTKQIRINNNHIYFEKITMAFLILFVSVFMLFPGFKGYENILRAKYISFCIICGGYVLIMLLFAIEGRIIGEISFPSPKAWIKETTWVQRLMIVYMILTWVSAIVSNYFPSTIIGVSRYEGALTISIYVLLFLLVSKYGCVSEKLIMVLAVAIGLFSTIAIIQFNGYNIFGLFPDGYNYFDANKAFSGQYLSTIGNVDLVAAFLCIVIPIIVGCIIWSKLKKRWLLVIPLAMALIVLLKMSVVAGFIGVGLGLIISLPVLLPLVNRNRIKIAIGVAFLIIGGITFIYLYDFGNGTIQEIHLFLNGEINDSFGSGRIHIWGLVLDEIPKNVLFGTGPDTMMFANFEPFSRFDVNTGKTIVVGIDLAHNELLNIIYHQGIVTFFAYAAGIVSILVKWIKHSEKMAEISVLGTAIICYSFQSMFGMSVCITAPFFWVTLGLLEKTINDNIERKQYEKKTIMS